MGFLILILVVALVFALILATIVTLVLGIARRVGGVKFELATAFALIAVVAVFYIWFDDYSEHRDNDGLVEFLIILPTLVISTGLVIGSRFLGKK